MKKLLNDFDLMPFGPHKGQQMRHVPARYLLGLKPDDTANHPGVSAYVKHAERQLRWELKHANHDED